MKKVFAILLALALLLPLGLVANAEEITAQPFYSLGWSDFDEDTYPYMDGLVTSTFKNIGDKAIIHYGGAQVMYDNYTEQDVTDFAMALKKEMDSRPEGMRYWTLFGISKIFKLAPENAVYLDHGVVQLKELTTEILKKYKEIGGQLDGLVLDTEYEGLACWFLTTKSEKQPDNAVENPMIYKQIVDDPRYATQIRPLLVERGFKFYENVTDLTPEIYSICKDSGSKYEISRSVWDTVMRMHLNRYANEWCYAPLKEYFPNASLSDYQSHDSLAWMKGVAVTDDGQSISGGGNTFKVGNVSCYSYYSARPNDAFYKDLKNYAGYNQAVYEPIPFNTFLHDANFSRRMYEATDTKLIAPWITASCYNDAGKIATLAHTPYYSEQILHLGLMDPEPFLVFMYRPEYTDAEWVTCCQTLNELMAELTRVAGYSDRKPIPMPESWNSDFVLSGMYANGRNIWRITPNTAEVSLADFKVEGSDPTFYVSGQTVTFPGGKILADSTISDVGTCGYWVETAKDVTPIIKNDADRFVTVPAYQENFESYKIGDKLTSASVREPGAWTIQPKGNDLVVTADGENKVLSFTGNSLMQSTVLPGNVTAADSYAMQQHWSITVTLPAGMTTEETLTLLNFVAEKQSGKDGGFQISGGKVSYSENGTYKPFTLDVSAGGKYIFSRALDFDANTCDYIITDAAGKEVASAKGVAIPAFNGKVTSIGFTCKKVAGKVLLDDYTLRVNGAAVDFGLYDAASGKLVEDASVARDSATAYRLSWLNATDKEKTATVMAAFYEGDTLKEEKELKKITMAPGYDGVELGTLDVPQGQTLKVYVKTDVKVRIEQAKEETPTTPTTPSTPTTPTEPASQPTDPATQPTDPAGNSSAGNSNHTLIIVLVVVAVVCVGIVVVVLVTKKKPNQ